MGEAKASCILCWRGVQLILAYRLARPAILAAGKGRGGNVFISSVSSLSFIFLSLLSLFHLFYYLFYFSFPFLWETTQNDPQGMTCRKPQLNQPVKLQVFYHTPHIQDLAPRPPPPTPPPTPATYLFPEQKKRLAGNKYEIKAALISAINRYLSSSSSPWFAGENKKLP